MIKQTDHCTLDNAFVAYDTAKNTSFDISNNVHECMQSWVISDNIRCTYNTPIEREYFHSEMVAVQL